MKSVFKCPVFGSSLYKKCLIEDAVMIQIPDTPMVHYSNGKKWPKNSKSGPFNNLITFYYSKS